MLLSLHADGPCNDLGISRSYVGILVGANNTHYSPTSSAETEQSTTSTTPATSTRSVSYDTEQTTGTPTECSNNVNNIAGNNSITHNCDILCPIGFVHQKDGSVCHCVCDPALNPYITNCSSETGNLLREGDFWFDYIHQLHRSKWIFCPCNLSSRLLLPSH